MGRRPLHTEPSALRWCGGDLLWPQDLVTTFSTMLWSDDRMKVHGVAAGTRKAPTPKLAPESEPTHAGKYNITTLEARALMEGKEGQGRKREREGGKGKED